MESLDENPFYQKYDFPPVYPAKPCSLHGKDAYPFVWHLISYLTAICRDRDEKWWRLKIEPDEVSVAVSMGSDNDVPYATLILNLVESRFVHLTFTKYDIFGGKALRTVKAESPQQCGDTIHAFLECVQARFERLVVPFSLWPDVYGLLCSPTHALLDLQQTISWATYRQLLDADRVYRCLAHLYCDDPYIKITLHIVTDAQAFVVRLRQYADPNSQSSPVDREALFASIPQGKSDFVYSQYYSIGDIQVIKGVQQVKDRDQFESVVLGFIESGVAMTVMPITECTPEYLPAYKDNLWGVPSVSDSLIHEFYSCLSHESDTQNEPEAVEPPKAFLDVMGSDESSVVIQALADRLLDAPEYFTARSTSLCHLVTCRTDKHIGLLSVLRDEITVELCLPEITKTVFSPTYEGLCQAMRLMEVHFPTQKVYL